MIALGKLAIWNLLTKKEFVAGNDPTLALLQKAAPDYFDDLIKTEKPSFGLDMMYGNDPYCLDSEGRSRNGLVLR